jgi:hypothetical protein
MNEPEDTTYLDDTLAMMGWKEIDDDLSESQYAKQVIIQEAADNRVVRFKLVYVDMAKGDVLAGLLLSQIMYWHSLSKSGELRLKVYKDGHYWIAKEQDEWWEETRLTRRQAQRCIEVLASLNLIETRSFRFKGLKTSHIRIKWKEFATAHKLAIKTSLNPVKHPDVQPEAPSGAFGFTLPVQPLTETTTDTTSDYSASGGQQPSMPGNAYAEASIEQNCTERNAKSSVWNCTFCGEKNVIHWNHAVTPCCGVPIHWTGNKWLDRRQQRSSSDSLAHIVNRTIPPHPDPAVHYLQQAAQARVKVDEVSEIMRYVTAHNLDAFKAQADKIIAADKEQGKYGRGLIIHVVNSLPGAGDPTKPKPEHKQSTAERLEREREEALKSL